MARRRKHLPEEPFDVTVDSLDRSAMGVARHGERAVRVFDALPGEHIRGRYLFGRKLRGKVEVLEVLQPAPERVVPRCPSFGHCGACALQHLSLSAQREYKQSQLLQAFEEQGMVRPRSVYAPLAGPAWNYRRKARLSVRVVPAKGRVLVGFRERNGRFVTDMNECHVLHPDIADALPRIAALIGELEQPSALPQVEVACGDSGSAMVLRHLESLGDSDLERLRRFADETGIGVYLQGGGPESVQLLTPPDLQLEYRVEELDLRFRFEPLDFVQVNAGLNGAMLLRALELLDPGGDDRVLDLFCGLGNFTLALATRAGGVCGVEGSAEMVGRARENAVLNRLHNVSFHALDLYQRSAAAPWPAARYTKVVLDPPRSGALELLPWIAASSASQVLYVSCNPETLARDAGVLVREYGFELSGAGIMDMFPHTPHSEAIALFEREGGEGRI